VQVGSAKVALEKMFPGCTIQVRNAESPRKEMKFETTLRETFDHADGRVVDSTPRLFHFPM
jgi:hypothetical protein